MAAILSQPQCVKHAIMCQQWSLYYQFKSDPLSVQYGMFMLCLCFSVTSIMFVIMTITCHKRIWMIHFLITGQMTPWKTVLQLCGCWSLMISNWTGQATSQHEYGVHPMKYAHGFVVLWIDVLVAHFLTSCRVIGLFNPYSSGLLHWRWGNLMIAPVPVT